MGRNLFGLPGKGQKKPPPGGAGENCLELQEFTGSSKITICTSLAVSNANNTIYGAIHNWFFSELNNFHFRSHKFLIDIRIDSFSIMPGYFQPQQQRHLPHQ